ncbi:hypothetical protein CEUSTIGMA_g2765.t1 [Chlamydomonas eustigma]|uniref:Uncharacterized protein n=1 Tax=Chlamydomonas eustigma TaxID=1157962 RepID=A0A250WXR4_9CHLO|nr:hypothetical protein CEUSTIGMA_g2765.t1 [Chlamydomonas eustigma]|eukprot:GAX75320.1 hypothetical protein CEUSTIGMA_g2765.t1 [Chlamydomonas eustigma]
MNETRDLQLKLLQLECVLEAKDREITNLRKSFGVQGDCQQEMEALKHVMSAMVKTGAAFSSKNGSAASVISSLVNADDLKLIAEEVMVEDTNNEASSRHTFDPAQHASCHLWDVVSDIMRRLKSDHLELITAQSVRGNNMLTAKAPETVSRTPSYTGGNKDQHAAQTPAARILRTMLHNTQPNVIPKLPPVPDATLCTLLRPANVLTKPEDNGLSVVSSQSEVNGYPPVEAAGSSGYGGVIGNLVVPPGSATTSDSKSNVGRHSSATRTSHHEHPPPPAAQKATVPPPSSNSRFSASPPVAINDNAVHYNISGQQHRLIFPCGPLLELSVSGHHIEVLLPALLQLKGSKLYQLFSTEVIHNEAGTTVPVKQQLKLGFVEQGIIKGGSSAATEADGGERGQKGRCAGNVSRMLMCPSSQNGAEGMAAVSYGAAGKRVLLESSTTMVGALDHGCDCSQDNSEGLRSSDCEAVMNSRQQLQAASSGCSASNEVQSYISKQTGISTTDTQKPVLNQQQPSPPDSDPPLSCTQQQPSPPDSDLPLCTQQQPSPPDSDPLLCNQQQPSPPDSDPLLCTGYMAKRQLPRVQDPTTCGTRIYLPYDPLCFSVLVQLLNMQYTLGAEFMAADMLSAVSAAYDSACRSMHLESPSAAATAMMSSTASPSHHHVMGQSDSQGPFRSSVSSSQNHHHSYQSGVGIVGTNMMTHQERQAPPYSSAPVSYDSATATQLHPAATGSGLFQWRWRATEHALGPFPVAWTEALMAITTVTHSPQHTKQSTGEENAHRFDLPGRFGHKNTALLDHNSVGLPANLSNIIYNHDSINSHHSGQFHSSPASGYNGPNDNQSYYWQQQQQHSVGNMYAIMQKLSQRTY